MTENDAITIIKCYYPKKKKFNCGIFIEVHDTECNFGQALNVAIATLKEIQQYRAIGTVEECREAVERLEAKPVKNRKILRNFHGNPYGIQGDCPNCGCERITSMSTDWCHVCGQHLKYDENLEGMEGGTGQV